MDKTIQLNKHLESVKKALSKKFYVSIDHKNIMSISPTKDSLPFAVCVYEDKYPDTTLLSFATDVYDAMLIADFVITVMHVSKVLLAESFYYDNMQRLHWGNDAYERQELDEISKDWIQDESPSDFKH